MDDTKHKKSSKGSKPDSLHMSHKRLSHHRKDGSSTSSKDIRKQHRSGARSPAVEVSRRPVSPTHDQYSSDRKTSLRHESGRRQLSPYRGRSVSPFHARKRPSAPYEKPSRVLGVFGLSFYTDERVLEEVFSQYGQVEDIQVILDHNSGVSRGFAFVYMRHLDEAIQAKELVPGTEIDGRKIRVDYSITDCGHTANSAGIVGRPFPMPFQNPGPYRQRSPGMSHNHTYEDVSRDYSHDRSRSPYDFRYY